MNATTKIYLKRLVMIQYQIELSKGSGLGLKDCLQLVLKDRGFKVGV